MSVDYSTLVASNDVQTHKALGYVQVAGLLASELSTLANIGDGDSIKLDGINTVNDGGEGGWYYSATQDKVTANLGTIIDISVALTVASQGTGTGTGCWLRSKVGIIDARWFGARPENVENNAEIQAALDAGKSIVINNGTFVVTHNIITLNDGNTMSGNATIQCLDDPVNNQPDGTRKNGIFTVTTNNQIHDLTFVGVNNALVAVVGLADVVTDCNDIKVKNITCMECGIFYAGPVDGFTYNRINDGAGNWLFYGPITADHVSHRISVLDCEMYGDTTYTAAANNLSDASKASGVELIAVSDAVVKNIIVRNSRLGAWAYGGAGKNAALDDINDAPEWCNGIIFDNVNAVDTESVAWMSKAAYSQINNCTVSEYRDVSVDYEGCKYCSSSGNNINSTGGYGAGGLTALNGCEHILFSGNTFISDRTDEGAAILVRDGNEHITYDSNHFVNIGGGRVKIRVWNDLLNVRPHNHIAITNNMLHNAIIETSVVETISVDGNKISNDGTDQVGTPGKFVNVIFIIDSKYATVTDNTLTFGIPHIGTLFDDCPIEIAEGADLVFEQVNVHIAGNQINDCSSTIGILCFFGAGVNSVLKIVDNLANAIHVKDPFIDSSVEKNQGQIICERNTSSLVRADGVAPASDLRRAPAATLRYNPTVIKAEATFGTTWAEFDEIIHSNPIVGDPIGWVYVGGAWREKGTVT